MQIKEFLSGGGGGVQARRPENSLDNVFILILNFFTVYRGGPMVLLQSKLYFSRDPEGVQHFPGGGGGPKFSRGKMHLTCDFPGGYGPPFPPPPQDLHMAMLGVIRHLRICNEYRLIQTTVAAHKQLVSAQPYCQ